MRRSVWIGFAGFCLLAGAAGLASGALVSGWPELLRLGVHDLVACLVLAWVVAVRKTERPGARKLAALAGWIAVLFAAGPLVFAAVGEHVGSSTATLVFGLVPFLTVFVVAQRDGGELRLLAPAVAAVGGLALAFPFRLPTTNAGWGALVSMLLCAALLTFAGIRVYGLMRGVPVVWAGMVGSAAAALVSLTGWLLFQRETVTWVWSAVGAEVAWALCVDLPLVLLTVLLAREMGPVEFSVRFVAVPIATILGSFALVWPGAAWTSWLGLGLAAGAGWMLLRDRGEQTAVL